MSQIFPRSKCLARMTAAFVAMGVLSAATAQAQTPAPAAASGAAPSIRLQNTASYKYDAISFPLCDPQAGNNQNCGSTQSVQILNVTNQIGGTLTQQLVDPLGRIVGCAGEVLEDYTGFSIALYEADAVDPTGVSLGRLISLTPTEVPNQTGNGIPEGRSPNTENSNPFSLTNGDRGVYNFMLDVRKGQLDQGRTYILVINPPRNSIYAQRRFRLTIGARNGNQVSYTATAIDGKPISSGNNANSITNTITIQDAEQTSLVIAALSFGAGICQAQEIQLIKAGDRATAEPGDTVIYRLLIRNLSSTTIRNLIITDTLPLGFRFLPKSVRGDFHGNAVSITTAQNGSTITFQVGTPLPQGATDPSAVMNIAYAAVVTPDAVRGNGKNSAIVTGQRTDNGFGVKDGPATYQLRLRSGIITDCGTIIGRVFIDKNFDGEQQPGEPGVPNAVVFMDDGNRITADADGLFSVANVLPGYRTGVLDLSSIPGYTLAPNLYFSERNSQSRLVHLEPSGMVRMNFAVTPSAVGGANP
ncbi:DUF11 domain-containing protein (plasmid) [Kovacikia minuta CCNUW1]|uniref:DUF11 domain-containing protein n=1 Tax=Kovacikia minuta TaxID=2931930 RepID=UPI001CC9D8D5|nr:DUF11 domain-containing protein [Kovacikia minuta]UBF29977.1 DUF11 domain-containing protein [Kovacikia minuta CCNUW1]